jgi:hypothetical protein
MKRRKFIGLIGGAMLPLVAHAEQPVPVIGFLSTFLPKVTISAFGLSARASKRPDMLKGKT